jgi:transposase
MTRTATGPDGQSFARLQSVPGLGQMLAVGLRYEIQDLARFPRVQAFGSSCRLGKCAKEANGKRVGTAGKKIGTGPWRWALAQAAILF